MTYKLKTGIKGTFKIKVKDFDTGELLEGVSVRKYADEVDIGTKETDADGLTGWFEADIGSWITGKTTIEGYNPYIPLGWHFSEDLNGETITEYLTTGKGDVEITVKEIVTGSALKDAIVYRKNPATGEWSEWLFTGDDYKAIFKDLPHGSHTFKASHKVYGDKIVSISHHEDVTEHTITLGAEKSGVRFWVVHPTSEGKEPLAGAKAHLWSEETGFDETKTADAEGYVDFGEVEPGYYEYHVEHTPHWQTFDDATTFVIGKWYEIEIKLFTLEEEDECPGWLRIIADFLGVTCKQARLLVYAIIAAIAIALVLSIIK